MKFKKTTLGNGLRIITVPMKGSPTATVLVVVEVGSNYESKEQNGLSHFLEHMMFKGTAKRPTALDISRELDGLGAENNAFTTSEFTGYYAKADKRHWKNLLEIISDIYLNLEKERGVILQEISMYEDLPQRKVWEVLDELLYGDTPAGRSIAGPPENIKKFKRENFIDYRNGHYTAEKTIVIIAGDISQSSALNEAKKYFKPIGKGKNLSKPKVKDTQTHPQMKILEKKTDQAHMVLGFRTFDASDKRIPAMTMLSTILGEGMSSRLFQKLREEMGACYYVRARHMENTDHGLFTIATGIDPTRSEEILKTLLDECHKLSEVLVTEGELNKAKELYIGHLNMGLETSDSQAEFVAEQEVTRRKIDTAKEVEKEIRAVKASEIQKLAKEIFRNDNLNLAVIGDIKNEGALKKVLKF